VRHVIEPRSLNHKAHLPIDIFTCRHTACHDLADRQAFASQFTSVAPIDSGRYSTNIRHYPSFDGYLVVACALTSLTCYNVLYKTSRALPSSQDTQHRRWNGEKHMQLFAVLALIKPRDDVPPQAAILCHILLCLGIRDGRGNTSYNVGRQRLYRLGALWLALGRWLKDTSLFRESWEIVIERSGRYWLNQQIFLRAAAWSVYVGIEG
jgi:hypothetical protein